MPKGIIDRENRGLGSDSARPPGGKGEERAAAGHGILSQASSNSRRVHRDSTDTHADDLFYNYFILRPSAICPATSDV